MKNKFLIGTVTVFVAIIVNIIVLNFLNSSSQQKNNFKRRFSKVELLVFNKNNNKLNIKNEYIFKVPSTDSIRESKNDSIVKGFQFVNISSSDFEFSNKKQKKIKLPVNSEILFMNKNMLVFSYNSKISVLNLKANILKFNIFNNLKMMSLTSLDSEKFLCFAELFENKKYNIGFFVIDFVKQSIKESKILKTNKESTFIESSLQYTGSFQKQSSSVFTYNREMYSKIFFFNNFGLLKKELNTNDNTKLPKIINQNNIEFSYSNDGKGYSNVGVFLKNNFIYVFSMACEFKNKIIIDKYSMDDNKYINSYKLDYKSFNSKDITDIIFDYNKNKIIIAFSFNYASFTFSRYI